MEHSRQKSAIRRLKIIGGQIEGLVRLIETGKSCDDIFPQVKAIKNAFGSFSSEISKEMMKECMPSLSDKEREKMESIVDHFVKL